MFNYIPMSDTVVLQQEGGVDDWGIAVGGVRLEYPGRITYNTERKEISIANGDAVVYTADILVNSDVNVWYSDRIVIPGMNGEQLKQPLSIQHKRDFNGNHVLTKVVI